jgi:3D (Asp-Asp-Asp) domain-containing protein
MTKPFREAEITAVNVLSFVRTRTFTTAIFFLIAMLIIMTIVLNTKIVQVNDSSGLRNVFTLRADPKTILTQCGIKLNTDDTIDFSGFKNNYGQIKIFRAFPVSITADQKTQNIYISRGTVSDVLNRAEIKVSSDDIVSVPLSEPVSQGLKVQIKRVTYKVVQQSQVVSCKLVQQQTPLLNKGKTKVIDPGKNGEYTITMKLRYVDGAVEKQDIIKKEVTKKPKDGKVLVGTNLKTPVSRLDLGGQILTNRGEPVRYTKSLTGQATAYYAKPGAKTASGKKAAVGNVAVDPKLIPFGSRLYIASTDGSFDYGYAVAADTGGFCKNGSGILTDLYFNSKTECNMFGKRKVKIYIIE